MIRPLRQRHRHTIIALGIFLPLALAVGVVARKPLPGMDSLPGGLDASAQQYKFTAWECSGFFTKSPVRIRLLREQPESGHFAVAFSAPKDFVKPDLIVYWVAGNPNFDDTLPLNAQLLGAFDSVALGLPDAASVTNGVVVLYSLADHEVVDVSKSVQFNSSPP